MKAKQAMFVVKRFVFVTVFSALFLSAGCPHEEYTLNLSMKGNILHRELTVAGVEQAVPEKELAALETLYDQKVRRSTAKNPSYTFTGKFTGKTPDDIGGNGSALYYDSSLGSVWAYVETFRGNDDIAGQIEDRIKAVNRIVDFLHGWLKHEFGTMADFAKLDTFLNTTARQDAKSLALYWWLLQNSENGVRSKLDNLTQSATTQPATGSAQTPASRPASQPAETPEKDIPQTTVFARMMQYILRRDYVQPEWLPKLMEGDLWGGDSEEKEIRDRLLRHILIRKVGLAKDSEIITGLLNILDNEDTLRVSILAYIKTTPQYAGTIKKLEAEAATQPATAAATQPADMDDKIIGAYMEPLLAGVMGEIFSGGTADGLKVTISLPPRAVVIQHNGKHDPQHRALSWKGRISPREEKRPDLPGICYAIWSAPDGSAQGKRFGKVVLTGSELAGYVAWTKSLPTERAKQWNTFLDTLAPATAAEAILTFQFEDDVKPAVHANQPGLRMLYTAITGKSPPKPDKTEAPAKSH